MLERRLVLGPHQWLKLWLSNLRVLLALFREYESASGQRVNASKTSFITPKRTSRSKAQKLSNLTGYRQAFFPMVYLGIPLTKGRISNALLQPTVLKITSKIDGWKVKLLNPAAKQVLIGMFFLASPSTCYPPSTSLKWSARIWKELLLIFSGVAWRRETKDIGSNGLKSAPLLRREA
ncbi:uncharacterized protein LOC131247103 [Magnolia sinica]|uniref:uncharacterized protein LOC131247103 n=1 Tax=Magnolia sinica TaxID=86752 RepID=UPI00265AC647|nr:uncharacterized protein LOC131247103 [Magnolia sinica]